MLQKRMPIAIMLCQSKRMLSKTKMFETKHALELPQGAIANARVHLLLYHCYIVLVVNICLYFKNEI